MLGTKLADPRPRCRPHSSGRLGNAGGNGPTPPQCRGGIPREWSGNEETLQPSVYAERLPEDLSDRQCFILDPMLATGGSLLQAINFIFAKGATEVTAVCLLGAPEGLAAIENATKGKDVTIVLGALDEKLNDKGFIVPGLGDAGDRLYGTVG